jgi:DNA-binding MarR family transcriptional regulator
MWQVGRGPFDNGQADTARRVVHGLSKVALALRHQAWRRARPRALTPTQGQILAYLAGRGLAGARVSEIAQALAVTLPTASDAVTALLAKRLVRKVQPDDDRRARQVVLTDAGRREARRAALWPDVLLDAVAVLAPGEQAVFLRALVKMIRTLQDQGRIPTSRMCATCVYFRPNVHPDPARPHHCAFVDAPFGDAQLRLDCPDHRTADRATQQRVWARFAATE